MMKRPFKATARNKDGLTFQFYFYHQNWCEIENAAKLKLNEIVNNDSLHKKFGPWKIENIDVA